jgi:DNA polymerase-3 subunit gamma/tau
MKLIEATNLKSIDEILNQVESIKPIPEKKVEQIIETKSQIKVETKVEPQIVQKSLEAQVVTTDVDEVVYEAIEEESDIFMDKYQILIEKLYDRSSELGECFERNFIYNGFENETLNIVSYAKDEDRNFLYKHFNLIKTFTCDIFGVNTKIDFKKDDATINQTSKPIKELNEVLNPKEEESFATSSGCVASSLDSSVEGLNQKELEVKDLLDTKMINQAKELFDIKRIVVKPKI